MRMQQILLGFLVCAVAGGAMPTPAMAQVETRLAGGIAVPLGDFADTHGRGFTVRGQAGVSLLFVSAHAQAGWSRFPTRTVATAPTAPEEDAGDLFHTALGARIALGPVFVGGNAAWFYGEENGTGFIPEVGLSIFNLEAVADAWLQGDHRWLGVRLGLKF